MKILEGGIANTLLDRHGERLTKGALEQLVASISRSYIPVGVEHDPRVPPLGRLASAHLKERSDGEFEVVGTFEIFDGGMLPLPDEKREMVIHRHELSLIHVAYDRNFRTKDDQEDIEHISSCLGAETSEEIKKSLEPIGILTIGGAFVLGGIANGLLGKLGSDAFDLLKEKVGKLMSRRKQEEKEKLLAFCFTVEKDGYVIEVETILTNPNISDIESFLQEGIHILDAVVPLYFDEERGVKKMVFEYRDSSLEISFAVRKDCVPLQPKLKVADIIEKLKMERER